MHWPGIKPRSTSWKVAMLTTIPPTLSSKLEKISNKISLDSIIQMQGTIYFQLCVQVLSTVLLFYEDAHIM